MTRAQPWWPVVGAVALAPIAGMLTVVSPVIGLLSVLAISVVSVATYYHQRLPRVFLGAVGVCLFGYTFLGKGFAYFGVAPLYVGELLLLFGVLAALLGGGIWPVLRSPVSRLMLVYAAWGPRRPFRTLADMGWMLSVTQRSGGMPHLLSSWRDLRYDSAGGRKCLRPMRAGSGGSRSGLRSPASSSELPSLRFPECRGLTEFPCCS